MTSKSNKKSKYVIIPEMRILWAEFAPLSEGNFVTSYSPGSDISGFFPQFPVLIKSDGEPWTLANLYLVRRLANQNTSYEVSTYQGLAKSLLGYLRFVEGSGLDPLDFHPRLQVKRPTYLYRQHLLEKVHEGQISHSTASLRINAVINFYKGLVSYKVLESEILEKVHKAKELLIPIINNSGFSQLLSISSSDLAIKTPTKSKDPDSIQDDGSLFPLTKDQQEILFAQLQHSEQCLFLFFLFALMTGARIQTVGTMRIETIKKARRTSDGDFIVTVGSGTKVDTKKGKILDLVIPRILHQSLLIYSESPTARGRRKTSNYGDTDNNYLFLNRNGTSYYTSKLEKRERGNPEHHRKVGINTAAKHISPKDGEAIRKFIGEVLLPRIHEENPAFPYFKFHDLRATFGMNLLESMLRHIDDHNAKVKNQRPDELIGTQWALEQVQQRMGHSNINTTMRYLNYRRNNQWRAKIIAEVENQLMQYIPRNARERLRSN